MTGSSLALVGASSGGCEGREGHGARQIQISGTSFLLLYPPLMPEGRSRWLPMIFEDRIQTAADGDVDWIKMERKNDEAT